MLIFIYPVCVCVNDTISEATRMNFVENKDVVAIRW